MINTSATAAQIGQSFRRFFGSDMLGNSQRQSGSGKVESANGGLEKLYAVMTALYR